MVSFWRYYWRISTRIASDCRKALWTTISAAALAIGAAYLQVHYFALSWQQTWPKAITTVICSMGLFLLYLVYRTIRAPWELHTEDAQTHAKSLEACKATVESEYAVAFADLQRENADMKSRLEEPRLKCRIEQHDMEEFMSPDAMKGAGIFKEMQTLAGLSDMDTYLTLFVTISNATRVPATAACAVQIHDRFHQEHSGSPALIPDKRRYPPIELKDPITYGAPRSGFLRFAFARKSKEQFVAGRLQLVVTDGTGQVSTAERQL